MTEVKSKIFSSNKQECSNHYISRKGDTWWNYADFNLVLKEKYLYKTFYWVFLFFLIYNIVFLEIIAN